MAKDPGVVDRWRDAIRASDLRPSQKHVALEISTYMNWETGGSAFPGAHRLAKTTGLHVLTVRRIRTELVEAGWLKVTTEGGKPGRKKEANEYAAALPVAEDNPSQRTTRRNGQSDPSSSIALPVAQGDPISSLTSSTNTAGARESDPECPLCHGRGVVLSGSSGPKAEPFDIACRCTAADYERPPTQATPPPPGFGMPGPVGATR